MGVQYSAVKWAISNVLCTMLTSKFTTIQFSACSSVFPALSLSISYTSLSFIIYLPLSLSRSLHLSRFGRVFFPLFSPSSPTLSFSSLAPFLFLSCLALHITDILHSVRVATYKILTACREFYIDTLLFIFNYSTSHKFGHTYSFKGFSLFFTIFYIVE